MGEQLWSAEQPPQGSDQRACEQQRLNIDPVLLALPASRDVHMPLRRTVWPPREQQHPKPPARTPSRALHLHMPTGWKRIPVREPELWSGGGLVGAYVDQPADPHSVRLVTIDTTSGLADCRYRLFRWGDIAQIPFDDPSFNTWCDINRREQVQAGEIIGARFVPGGYDVPHIAFFHVLATPRNWRTQTAVTAARQAAKGNPKPLIY